MPLDAALYLIPVGMSDSPIDHYLPAHNVEITRQIKHFIVENVRTARRFLKKCDKAINIDELTFYELNNHTDLSEVESYLAALAEGQPIGVMSEAGCPAVADPGALPVAIAQRKGYKVVPLVGPSSILMAQMASGFNGQGFAFNGYLPIETSARNQKIKELENDAYRKDMTQIFIETPYRNNRLIETLCKTLRPDTLLCVASAITDSDHESIVTLKVKQWAKRKYNYDKIPTIFLIYHP
ncbi:MAG: SAM-dependent methyltransferase [Muribaculaceae bacterium]|jgi:16S rRNA (cytidine1402-2'-O)-methyltransferase|nr:SAM-dependent methyltransferase [Muribaculaceae bacterium]MBQ2370352.1 SAM-dependent methyltransferase [Muribaculaceae bacterium]MBQ2399287.1 SAM-dependent methyltransferase [Muribaculaceae bacterium]MBQ2439720.1 SAM-dependent methyltransferase [Muribaculaceae bacterium]MBQ5724107.1 SAM-dependent methyltransferase [Muribaculaceae bacterium]